MKKAIELIDALDALERIEDQQKLDRRTYIIDTDPNAPICIRCRYCQQRGFIFECPAHEDFGLHGIVYYKRRGHKARTYGNVPMKDDECQSFEETFPSDNGRITGNRTSICCWPQIGARMSSKDLGHIVSLLEVIDSTCAR